MWEYAKGNVYRNNPEKVRNSRLISRINHRTILTEIFQRVIENFAITLNGCMNRNGRHIEDFIHYQD